MIINWSAVFAVVVALVALVAVVLAIWFSRNRRVTYQADSAMVEYSRRLEELTLRVMELEIGMSHYRVGVAKLTAQVVGVGLEPAWRPLPITAAAENGEPVLVQIYTIIAEHFSMAEMDEIALMAGIEAEEYGGEERPSRALHLVQLAVRTGRLEDLVAAGRKKRPRVKWPVVVL